MKQTPRFSQLNIIVNGKETEVADGSVLSTLVESLGLNLQRLAIELNRRIVRRTDWPTTKLAEDDKVEIVHFVGGGIA